jgi:hypothetical protein
MIQEVGEAENWAWQCVGHNENPAFLGPWDADAYIVERPAGWYICADGRKIGAEYIYRLPGRGVPSGPYTRERAESLARQMIGLGADATPPAPDHLVLYQAGGIGGRDGREAKDVTGRRWVFTSGGSTPRSCSICDAPITTGWSQGRWVDARHYVCLEHVEMRDEARPAEAR